MDAFDEKPQPPAQINNFNKIQAAETDFPTLLRPLRSGLYSALHAARKAHDLPPRNPFCIVRKSAGEEMTQQRLPHVIGVSEASIPTTPHELHDDDEEGWGTLAYQK